MDYEQLDLPGSLAYGGCMYLDEWKDPIDQALRSNAQSTEEQGHPSSSLGVGSRF